MSFSRLFYPRYLVVTSIVCCAASCSDDDQKPAPSPDAGDDSSESSSNHSSHTSSSTSASSSSSSHSGSGGTTSGPNPADAGEDSDDVSAVDGGDVDSAIDAGADGGSGEPTPHDAILGGILAPLMTPEAGANPSGRVQLQKLSSGQTVITLQAVGLEPDTTYGAHVHALPCEYDNGGGHYKVDPEITTAEENNEIWPGFTTDETGVGYGRITVDHRVRGDALSLVIHDPEMNKYLCADLLPERLEALEAEGTFSPFALKEDIDDAIEGSATLVHEGDTTSVTLSVTGLDPSEQYMAHVHALPCDITSAGGHYKVDPTEVDTLESNEVWPMLELTDAGAAMGQVTVEHLTRLDAQSVVIHRQDGDTALKVACADLVYSGFESFVTEGTLIALPAEDDAGVPELAGEATMTRSLDGTTAVELSLQGLVPEADYGVHVHNMPCSLGNGGAHYKWDESVSATLEENEIWLNVTADEEGEAQKSVTVPYLARPEAQAIVVHSSSGARLGCLDLTL
jgi:hypothetical protein